MIKYGLNGTNTAKQTKACFTMRHITNCKWSVGEGAMRQQTATRFTSSLYLLFICIKKTIR